ncbi:AAA family ATPase [Halostella sp. JP-L12]|uniref:adenylate kinase family protein n=1 Tax=Halostella TaxID=1843185 RepID=UPI000EF7AB11|nr:MULTISPECIES: AAA family ATPase [Halostella]NHN49724.1 AAA family ATPase [Halostella sp. JP-L12]
MRVTVTGTPGTGKTTATDRLDTDLDVVHLNEVVREEELYDEVDEERDSVIADVGAVEEWLGDREDLILDSHLAHHLDSDRVVVLRCHPEELERRLRERGESEAKAEENAESEALDVILTEAVEGHGTDAVYEIDTTDRDPDAVADEIEAVVAGEREPSAGTVSFIDYL